MPVVAVDIPRRVIAEALEVVAPAQKLEKTQLIMEVAAVGRTVVQKVVQDIKV
jgi:hypothetical protein